MSIEINSLVKKIHLFFLFYYSYELIDIEFFEDCPGGGYYHDYVSIFYRFHQSDIYSKKTYSIKNRKKFNVMASPKKHEVLYTLEDEE